MLKIIKPNRPFGPLVHQCKCRLSTDPKTPEEPEKVVAPKKKYDPKEVTKEDLQWRTPWHKKEGAYYSTLRTFYNKDNHMSLLQWVQSPIDLSPSGIRKWWTEKKEFQDAYMQQYIPERHQMLGSELAAAHFVVHRGGAVKFHEENNWIKADERNNYLLPRHYQQEKFLQAVDCTDMDLYYEGLDNLRDLKAVEWLSLNGCNRMDDYCIDVISNIFSHSLIYLDLRNCLRITENGIGALYKMRNLKILYVDDLLRDTKYELTCLLLQELNPDLDIKSDVINFEIK